VTDHYLDGTYRWWHLSVPSPELVDALSDGWLHHPSGARALDVGCGLGTEAAHLHERGWQAVGLDVSPHALAAATSGHPGPAFIRANVLDLPLAPSSFDVAVDRGCFHYLRPGDRRRYADALRSVLRPNGRLLLRASLRAAGIRNDIDEGVILTAFAGWGVDSMGREQIPSDTRLLDVLSVRLTSPAAIAGSSRAVGERRGDWQVAHGE
jgi:SAM-dependent methyltransferase